MPSGWMYREQISYHRSFEEQILPAIRAETAGIRPQLINQAAHGGSAFWGHRLLSNVLLQSVDSPLTAVALAQTGRNQAILACALERYWLARGQFPASLEELNPQFLATLPVDVTSGQSMKYRRTDDGRFQLYSFGWNGTDDGGKVVKNKDGKTPDFTQGDWVWPQYPEE
jgi:hypothetical protein